MLIVTIIFKPFFQLSPQSALLLHNTPPLLQRLPPPLVYRIKAHHTLAFLVVKQLIVVLPTRVHNPAIPDPGRRREQIVEGVGELGAP